MAPRKKAYCSRIDAEIQSIGSAIARAKRDWAILLLGFNAAQQDRGKVNLSRGGVKAWISHDCIYRMLNFGFFSPRAPQIRSKKPESLAGPSIRLAMRVSRPL